MMIRSFGNGRVASHAALVLVFTGAMAGSACVDRPDSTLEDARLAATSLLNLDHLDHLGEDVVLADSTLRIIHIYAEAPDYEWVGDDDEGIACVDDAARAAVVYLRHFELTGNRASLEKGKSLVRFVMYMQKENGLFYNFVWDNTLRINETHENSMADEFGWWASRAVWVLGTAARILKQEDPAFARASADRVRRALPHITALLERYGETEVQHGRSVPVWLVGTYGSDATSEMLLGLNAANVAFPSAGMRIMIERFATGIMQMQYGSMRDFPYAAHASYMNEWHGWGNSQTQALSEAGFTSSAKKEAESFYPRLLIDGWLHSFRLDDPNSTRRFEQIAYAVRGVAVGLVRLHKATGDARYARMAGLAASWFTGNNVERTPMYDAATGRGYDGINGPGWINQNSGAESTIEALFTVLEVAQLADAQPWMFARGGEVVTVGGGSDDRLQYRIFSACEKNGQPACRLGLIMNLTTEKLLVLEDEELDTFLDERHQSTTIPDSSH